MTTYHRYRVRGSDGLALALHHWRGEVTRGTLYYLHGIQSHAGWLRQTGPELARRGVDVFVLDRRGSGASAGERGHSASADLLIDDQDRAFDAVRRHAATRRVGVVGQSFGASLLAAWLVDRPQLLDPVVFCAPALGQQWARANGDPATLAAVRRRRGTDRVRLKLKDTDYTGDPDALEFMAADPMMIREITVSMAAAMVALEDSYLTAAAIPTMGPPLLALPAHDRVIDLDAARAVLRQKAPGTRVRRFDADRHYIEFSSARAAYWDWLAARTLAKNPADAHAS